MTPRVAVALPEPPSANRYWRHVGNQVLLAKDARVYRKNVQWRILAERIQPIPPAKVICVTLTWYRSRKSGDLDNRIKQVLDALKPLVYDDDRQIVEIHAYRKDDKANPRIELTVEALA